MATTSLWRVKGWLGKLVVYVENPDKTENPKFFEKSEITVPQTQGLSDVIEYAVDTRKTAIEVDDESSPIMRQFVSGVNCNPVTARDTMMNTKRAFDKMGGTVAYHGYQSFAPGEATPETAHEIGLKLAQSLWGERYQVLVATHLDKSNHLHNHFIINTVSFVDGIKFHRTEKDYYEMQRASDALCQEYGLSVIKDPKRGKSKHYAEWKAEKEGRPTWRGLIRTEVDDAISQSMTENQFVANLKKRGYEVKLGKYISVKPPGREKFFRLETNFGEAYSRQGIIKQMQGHRPKLPEPGPKRQVKVYRFTGSIKTVRKITGFRALYFQYLYLMGKLPKKNPRSLSKVHFLFREDLIKIDKISNEIKLLCRYRIDTVEQLFSYRAGLTEKIETLIADRADLRKQLRRLTDEPSITEIKGKIAILTSALKEARKEVGLCDDITVRTEQIKEKRQKVKSAAISDVEKIHESKEMNRNDQFR